MINPLLLALTVTMQAPTDSIAIIPRPVSVTHHPGVFKLHPRTVVMARAGLEPLAGRLADYLRPATGYDFTVTTSTTLPDAAGPDPTIIMLQLDSLLSGHGAESYSIDISSSTVVIKGASPAGVFYGLQSLRQLFPPEIFRKAPVGAVRWSIPCVSIVDYPRFGWRGMHLDVVRHFMPKEFVEKYIDLLALYKFNRFHWHLTDDQGWRIEIKKYPKLTEVAAWRVNREDRPWWGSREPQRPGEKATYGGFYTQDEIREVVRYAASRNITIVPEIEMPAHETAVLAAYPQFSCTALRQQPPQDRLRQSGHPARPF